MAKSSINILKNCAGFSHNDRSEKKQPEYFLPVEFRKENEFDRNSIEAEKLLNEYIKEAKENYKKETGQKFQGRVLNFEAVVNLNQNHTMEDLKKLNENIEKEFGFRAVQTAIHRDEGHIKDGRPIYNYHAHIVFCNLDKNGKTLLKNMTKSDLSKLQDLVSDNLQMERGKPAKETGAKHKHHTVYRAEKEKEHLENENKSLKMELVKAKELQELNKELREELKQAAATREDYAKLEALNKDLKEKIKSKELTNEQLTKIIDEYKQEKAPKTNEIVLNDKSIEKQEKEVLGSLKDDFQSELEANKKGLLGKSYEVKLKEEFSHSPNVESLTLFMRVKKKLTNAYDIIKAQAIKILNLETENKSLKKENDKLSRELREAELEIKELSKDKSELSPLNSEKKETTLDKLVTNYEKSKLEINKPNSKAQTLEEILKSNPSNLKEDTKDLKAYIKKETPTRRLDMRK
ncbi:hypothetical protein [Aliarcobacter butzleri]|nr:hypothetical protein [Aliarcobacter butzleri]